VPHLVIAVTPDGEVGSGYPSRPCRHNQLGVTMRVPWNAPATKVAGWLVSLGNDLGAGSGAARAVGRELAARGPPTFLS
jgi:hypothetical protein